MAKPQAGQAADKMSALLTVIAIFLLILGVIISATVGVSSWGIIFPIGATLLFVAERLDP